MAPGAAKPVGHRARSAAARPKVRYAPLLLLACTIAALSGCTPPAATPETPSVALAPAAPSPTPGEPSLPAPEDLIGADRDLIAERLGKPVFLMRAQASEIWQYRAPGCVLDVYLYEEAGVMRVAYIEARDLAGAALAPGDCMRAVHEARQPWPDATTAGT